jgi:hypothetical protein
VWMREEENATENKLDPRKEELYSVGFFSRFVGAVASEWKIINGTARNINFYLLFNKIAIEWKKNNMKYEQSKYKQQFSY